jgi:hypothetical protein
VDIGGKHYKLTGKWRNKRGHWWEALEVDREVEEQAWTLVGSIRS